jgi:hypothetical protein
MPLSLHAPKGAISPVDFGEMMPPFMPTMPYSRPSGNAPDAADVAAVEMATPSPPLISTKGPIAAPESEAIGDLRGIVVEARVC